MIDLYFWPTPNGKKITILLEEIELAYKLIPVNLRLAEQLDARFLKLNRPRW